MAETNPRDSSPIARKRVGTFGKERRSSVAGRYNAALIAVPGLMMTGRKRWEVRADARDIPGIIPSLQRNCLPGNGPARGEIRSIKLEFRYSDLGFDSSIGSAGESVCHPAGKCVLGTMRRSGRRGGFDHEREGERRCSAGFGSRALCVCPIFFCLCADCCSYDNCAGYSICCSR